MEALFIKILNMSITACWMIIAAIFLRLLLQKAPKNIRFILWTLVGIRLVCPVSFESIFSIIPNTEPIQNDAFAAGPYISNFIPSEIIHFDQTADPAIQNSQSVQTAGASISVMTVLSVIWIVGIVAMAAYAIFSYGRIHRKVGASLKTDKNVYICDDIDSPFILGIIRPKIYLPSDLTEEEMNCVIAHEISHIKRLDHIWKPLGFAILSVYWFNPLIWVAYILLCRDIEFACDEKVISKMGLAEKRLYSQALLSCSISKRTISACPLAFGEVGVKNRVKSILNYKKPVFWVIIASIIICIVAGLLLLTDPKSEKKYNIPLDGAYSVSFICKDPGSSTTIIQPYIVLDTEYSMFSFCYSGLSSYDPCGIYNIENGKLILNAEDGSNHYVFDIIAENKVAFNESESTELPSYRISGDSFLSEKPLKDGAVFEIMNVVSSDEAEFDEKDETLSEDAGSIVYNKITDSNTKYNVYKNHGTSLAFKPILLLYCEDNTFNLSYPHLSSLGVWGTYETSGNKLICTSHNGIYKYVFDITDGGYVFNDEVPFEHPQYNGDSNMEILADGDLLIKEGSDYKKLSTVVKSNFCRDKDGNIDELKPILDLYPQEKTFRLIYDTDAAVSYNGIGGTYEESENKLTCTAYGGEYKYVFEITEDGYIFSNEVPFAHPLCNENTPFQPLEDGDVLKNEQDSLLQ